MPLVAICHLFVQKTAKAKSKELNAVKRESRRLAAEHNTQLHQLQSEAASLSVQMQMRDGVAAEAASRATEELAELRRVARQAQRRAERKVGVGVRGPCRTSTKHLSSTKHLCHRCFGFVRLRPEFAT
jgi:hypothetical protein